MVVTAALIVFVAAVVLVLRSRPTWGLPYHDSFASGQAAEWTAYGGTWQIENAAMRNDSDERGAKLMTGSPNWRDYSFSADVELLGEQGDAGLILRASQEEQGVDSYRGYYAGLRSNDGNLIIGLADHGWVELVSQPMPHGVRAFHWYHLKAVVHGCQVSAYASEIPDGQVEAISYNDPTCFSQGRIGLRSHSSGGAWKNLEVLPWSAGDAGPAHPSFSGRPAVLPYAIDEPVTQGGLISDDRDSVLRQAGSAEGNLGSDAGSAVTSIGSLRMVRTKARYVTVRGIVTLNSSRLYVQDATGGVAILTSSKPNLKVGDEVEVNGEVEVHDFTCIIRNASIRLLWERSPVPPLAVTASQAATGAYDATFVEVDGTLSGVSAGPENTLVLALGANDQSFNAIVSPSRGNAGLRHVTRQTSLRLRGVCAVDPRYTHSLTPFVLLVASSDDIDVLAGPPWWSARNLIISGLAVLTLALLAYLLYLHARHWRLRAIVNERERIAHDMHDTLAQSFVGIGFQLQAISNSVPENLPGINQQLDLACELVRHSHEEATRSLSTLRREFLEYETLDSALHSFASRLVEHGGVTVEVKVSGEDSGTPYPVKDALFRIGQEVIANAIRHGSPTVLSIFVNYAADRVSMVIEDNGKGFDPAGQVRGFGLTGIRKRAERISGGLKITSSPGSGTRVDVVAPIPPRFTWPKARRYFWRGASEGEVNGKRAARRNPYSYR
jgi:signal transduction histidine kinase